MVAIGSAADALVPRIMPKDGDLISNTLGFVRKHLGMEISYLSEIVGAELVFRAVDAEDGINVIAVGDRMPLADAYCLHILEGRLPQLIADTDKVAFSQTIDITQSFPIRSHVSVPIYRTDGSVFGMFCCLSRKPQPNLNSRDLEVMRAFAALSADQVNARLSSEGVVLAKRAAIEQVLENKDYSIALQPIFAMETQNTAGYEALCRFAPQPYRPPNVWFDDAAEVGLQSELELQVIQEALALLPQLDPDCYLAVNISPSTLASGKLTPLVRTAGGHRIVVEITEHAAIEDLDVLLMEIDALRDLGVRIAVDDAGAGYSGLQQILRLRPDVIKLDMSLTKDVDKDLARRSLASALVQFAKDTHASVVAEGIETEVEMLTLATLGVEMGQGYFLGRPALAEEWIKAAQKTGKLVVR